jgi:hypothetical protein
MLAMASGNKNDNLLPQHLLQKLYPDTRTWQVWKPMPDDQRMEALDEILSQKLVAALPALAGLFAIGGEEVKAKAARTVAELFATDVDTGCFLLSAGLHRLLDYGQVSASSALNQIKRDLVWSLKVPVEHEWAVFGLISFHGNGWVREAALDRLSKATDGHEIPFLLYRSNDWVSIVAQKAAGELGSRLSARPVRQFTTALPVLYRLRARQRGLLSDLQAQLLRRLCLEEDIDHLQTVASSLRPGARRWLLGLITSVANVRPEAESLVRVLRNDPDPVVRLTAWNFFWKGSIPEAELLNGLGDSWAAIRLRSLELLCAPLHDSRRGVLIGALFDGSTMVRATARYFLEKLGSTDVAAIYRQRLLDPNGVSPSAIFGLSETGKKEDAQLLSGFLENPKASVRKAAVIALGNLDTDGFVAKIKNTLFDQSAGVSKAARQVLEKHPALLSAAFIMDAIGETKPLYIRKSGILLIRSLSKWDRITTLLGALQFMPEFNDIIREEVRRWLSTYNRSWLEPRPDQLTNLRELVVSQAGMLAPEIVRDLQHIAGSPQGAR